MAAAGLGVSSDSEPEAASYQETADSRVDTTDGHPQADLDSEDDVLERMMQAAHIHQGVASHEVIIAAPLSMCQYANGAVYTLLAHLHMSSAYHLTYHQTFNISSNSQPATR